MTFSPETLFSLFGFLFLLVALGGGHRIEIKSIKLGPVSKTWRIVAVILGLVTWVGVGFFILNRQ